jgi:hypothetical protein
MAILMNGSEAASIHPGRIADVGSYGLAFDSKQLKLHLCAAMRRKASDFASRCGHAVA